MHPFRHTTPYPAQFSSSQLPQMMAPPLPPALPGIHNQMPPQQYHGQPVMLQHPPSPHSQAPPPQQLPLQPPPQMSPMHPPPMHPPPLLQQQQQHYVQHPMNTVTGAVSPHQSINYTVSTVTYSANNGDETAQAFKKQVYATLNADKTTPNVASHNFSDSPRQDSTIQTASPDISIGQVFAAKVREQMLNYSQPQHPDQHIAEQASTSNVDIGQVFAAKVREQLQHEAHIDQGSRDHLNYLSINNTPNQERVHQSMMQDQLVSSVRPLGGTSGLHEDTTSSYQNPSSRKRRLEEEKSGQWTPSSASLSAGLTQPDWSCQVCCNMNMDSTKNCSNCYAPKDGNLSSRGHLVVNSPDVQEAVELSPADMRLNLIKRFASVLREHGALKPTDSLILNLFMQLTAAERKLVMDAGSIREFLVASTLVRMKGQMLEYISPAQPPASVEALKENFDNSQSQSADCMPPVVDGMDRLTLADEMGTNPEESEKTEVKGGFSEKQSVADSSLNIHLNNEDGRFPTRTKNSPDGSAKSALNEPVGNLNSISVAHPGKHGLSATSLEFKPSLTSSLPVQLPCTSTLNPASTEFYPQSQVVAGTANRNMIDAWTNTVQVSRLDSQEQTQLVVMQEAAMNTTPLKTKNRGTVTERVRVNTVACQAECHGVHVGVMTDTVAHYESRDASPPRLQCKNQLLETVLSRLLQSDSSCEEEYVSSLVAGLESALADLNFIRASSATDGSNRQVEDDTSSDQTSIKGTSQGKQAAGSSSAPPTPSQGKQAAGSSSAPPTPSNESQRVPSIKQLNMHTAVIREPRGPPSCSTRGQRGSFGSRELRQRSMEVVTEPQKITSKRKYDCSVCGAVYWRGEMLKEHMESEHPADSVEEVDQDTEAGQVEVPSEGNPCESKEEVSSEGDEDFIPKSSYSRPPGLVSPAKSIRNRLTQSSRPGLPQPVTVCHQGKSISKSAKTLPTVVQQPMMSQPTLAPSTAVEQQPIMSQSAQAPTTAVQQQQPIMSQSAQAPSTAVQQQQPIMSQSAQAPSNAVQQQQPIMSQSAQDQTRSTQCQPNGPVNPTSDTTHTLISQNVGLLQHIILMLAQANPALASNPVLLQFTAQQHMLALLTGNGPQESGSSVPKSSSDTQSQISEPSKASASTGAQSSASSLRSSPGLVPSPNTEEISINLDNVADNSITKKPKVGSKFGPKKSKMQSTMVSRPSVDAAGDAVPVTKSTALNDPAVITYRGPPVAKQTSRPERGKLASDAQPVRSFAVKRKDRDSLLPASMKGSCEVDWLEEDGGSEEQPSWQLTAFSSATEPRSGSQPSDRTVKTSEYKHSIQKNTSSSKPELDPPVTSSAPTVLPNPSEAPQPKSYVHGVTPPQPRKAGSSNSKSTSALFTSAVSDLKSLMGEGKAVGQQTSGRTVAAKRGKKVALPSASMASEIDDFCDMAVPLEPAELNSDYLKPSNSGPDAAEWCQVGGKKKGKELKETVATDSFLITSGYQQLVAHLGKQFPNLTRAEVDAVIKEVRLQKGALKGLAQITTEAEKVLRKHTRKYTKLGAKGAPQILEPLAAPTTQQKSTPAWAPSVVQTPSSFDFIQQDKGTHPRCVICMDAIMPQRQDAKALECGHVFHSKCIDAWFSKQERTCPSCRTHALTHEEFPPLGS